MGAERLAGEKLFTCQGCGYTVALVILEGHAPPTIICPDCQQYLLSPSALSRREIEVLKLLVAGYSARQAADLLCVCEKTIMDHRSNIYAKVKIDEIASLTKYALRKGLTTLEIRGETNA